MPKNQPEEWRPVVGHAGYEVSSLGRVKSWVNPGRRRRQKAKQLALTVMDPGYKRIMLGGKNRRYVHHLVLEAFIGPRPDKYEGAHLNGNPLDNQINNLAWVTRKENLAHRIEHGTVNEGERNGQAKLTTDVVLRIRDERQLNGLTSNQLAKKFGTSPRNIRRILARETWGHVE